MLEKKYKPNSLEELILPLSIKKLFEKGFSSNYFFHSSSGTGKTSTAVAIAKQFNYEYLLINGSSESSVNNLKEIVVPFCETTPLTNPNAKKIVILDEVDGISLQYRKALRGVMNECNDKAYFVFTCNSLANDDAFRAIMSRCRVIDFSFKDLPDEEKSDYFIQMIKRFLFIAEKEGIKIEKKVAWNFLQKYAPDIRKAILNLGFFIDKGITEITEDEIKNMEIQKSSELFDLILNDFSPQNIHKIIYSDYRNSVNESFESLHTDFFTYLIEKKPEYIKLFKNFAISIANWDSKKDTLVLPVHALKACIYELQLLINTKI